MSESAAGPFFDVVSNLIAKARSTQGSAILKAAALTCESLIQGGMLHVFGTGHSHMMAEEIFLRAGGLSQVNAILDPGLMLQVSSITSTQLERLENYTPIILSRYDLRPDDVMFIVSNSGRNAGPIDAALYARQRGLKVIVLTSANAYKEIEIRHPLGRHLSELADVVIDSCVPKGDAAISLPGLEQAIGPTSTILGATLIQAYIYETVRMILERGEKPRILVSANADQPQDLRGVFEDIACRIRHL